MKEVFRIDQNSCNSLLQTATSNSASEELVLQLHANNISDTNEYQPATINLKSTNRIQHIIKEVPVIESTREKFSINISSESTSYTTGALVISGGVGVAKNLYCNQTINVNSITSGTISSTTLSSSTLTTRELGNDIYCLKKLVLTDTTNSTEPYIGALTVLGGAGIQGDMTIGGEIDYMSDKNLKTNIITIQNPLQKLESISGVEFQWKHSSKLSAGVIAQEIEQIMPVAVTNNEQGYKSVKYNCLIGLLIEGIKQQQLNYEQLTNTLSTIQTKVTQLDKIVKNIQHKLIEES